MARAPRHIRLYHLTWSLPYRGPTTVRSVSTTGRTFSIVPIDVCLQNTVYAYFLVNVTNTFSSFSNVREFPRYFTRCRVPICLSTPNSISTTLIPNIHQRSINLPPPSLIGFPPLLYSRPSSLTPSPPKPPRPISFRFFHYFTHKTKYPSGFTFSKKESPKYRRQVIILTIRGRTRQFVDGGAFHPLTWNWTTVISFVVFCLVRTTQQYEFKTWRK